MRSRAWIGNIFLLVASVAAALGCAEAGARLSGYYPFMPIEDDTGVLQQWNVVDRELGWAYRPNSFTTIAGKMRIWPDATRRTRSDEHTEAPAHVLLIGCSYTQSFGVDDEASLGWLLQQRFSQLDFRNRATGGYGSYQSLLVMRRHFAEAKKPTALVVYGLASFHGVRDRASRTWLPSLKTHGRLAAFIPPHADVDKRGELIEYPGRFYEPWRAAEVSAVANLAQKAFNWYVLSTADDYQKEFKTQFAIVRAMRDLAASHGARFLVALIYAPDYWQFRTEAFEQLQRLGIDYVNCSPPDIPHEHPNADWTARHAACIAPATAKLVN
jgi:hypothetical protein